VLLKARLPIAALIAALALLLTFALFAPSAQAQAQSWTVEIEFDGVAYYYSVSSEVEAASVAGKLAREYPNASVTASPNYIYGPLPTTGGLSISELVAAGGVMAGGTVGIALRVLREDRDEQTR
jgi:hypothetical protein